MVRNMSNDELEEALERFGESVSVNWLSRGTIESKIEEKLDGYTDTEIANFIDKYF